MKITLQNGIVVEGTAEELNQLDVMKGTSIARRAVQGELFPERLNISMSAPAPAAAPEAEVQTAARVGRPQTVFTGKIHDAIAKLTATGKEQRVAIAAKDEKHARSIVTRHNRVYKTQMSVNKMRVGDRVTVIISQ